MKKLLLFSLAVLLTVTTLACQAPALQPPAAQTPSPTPMPSPPLATPTPEPVLPTPDPTIAPTPQPTQGPTPRPTQAPTPKPTKTPDTGKLSLAMKKSTYYPDSVQLDATLKNGTKYTYTYGAASYLQQKTTDGWKAVPFKEDVAWNDIAYILKPGESRAISVPLSWFATLQVGTYRVVKDLYRETTSGPSTAEKVSAQFAIADRPQPDLSGLTLSVKRSVYAPGAEIQAMIKNASAYTCTFGAASYLQQKTADGWKSVPFKEDVAWIAIAYLLKPGESKDVSLSLSLFGALPAGTYRLVKDVTCEKGGESFPAKLSGEFRIESAS